MDMQKFMVKDHPVSPITEEYRKIATNIEFANIDNNLKTVMVTSSLVGEGKTTTICNIATVMTELNKNVLLIDLDLRKPSVHKFLNLSNKRGVVDLLLNKDDYNRYINSVYPKLHVITSGKIPSNSAEILNSNSIKELIKILSLQYDYIFLDSPPVELVSDPMIIATYVNGVILVIAHGQTEIEIVKKSVDSLKKVNSNIIGTILNKMPFAKNNYYYSN